MKEPPSLLDVCTKIVKVRECLYITRHFIGLAKIVFENRPEEFCLFCKPGNDVRSSCARISLLFARQEIPRDLSSAKPIQ